MNYFVRNDERDGSCYHEFYKGKWDGKTFWKEDSLSLHDDFMFECKGFVEAIIEVIPQYNTYGNTEVSIEAWQKIGELILEKDEQAQAIYKEADIWLKTVLEEYNCFTILGL